MTRWWKCPAMIMVGRQERLGIDGRAPQYLLREARFPFGRVEPAPDCGMDAVGADKDIRLILQFRSGCAIA